MNGDVTGACHPACLLLPEMTDAEYRELVEDIRENGLFEPILVDPAREILDGRHRWRACQELGIEPRVKIYAPPLAGRELEAAKVALIVSRNIHRRHMSRGQRAMALAMIYPELQQGKRREPSELSSEVSARYVNQARTVLREDPELAKAVLAGTVSLSEAYRLVVAADDSPEPGEDLAEELADELADDERDRVDAEPAGDDAAGLTTALRRAMPYRDDDDEDWRRRRARRRLAAQASTPPPPRDPDLIHMSAAIQWAYLRSGDVNQLAYTMLRELEAERLWQLVRALERRLEQNGYPRPASAGLELGPLQ